jgi:hypothetical protein
MLTANQPIVAILGSLRTLLQAAGPGQPLDVLSALHSAQGGIGISSKIPNFWSFGRTNIY